MEHAEDHLALAGWGLRFQTEIHLNGVVGKRAFEHPEHLVLRDGRRAGHGELDEAAYRHLLLRRRLLGNHKTTALVRLRLAHHKPEGYVVLREPLERGFERQPDERGKRDPLDVGTTADHQVYGGDARDLRSRRGILRDNRARLLLTEDVLRFGELNGLIAGREERPKLGADLGDAATHVGADPIDPGTPAHDEVDLLAGAHERPERRGLADHLAGEPGICGVADLDPWNKPPLLQRERRVEQIHVLNVGDHRLLGALQGEQKRGEPCDDHEEDHAHEGVDQDLEEPDIRVVVSGGDHVPESVPKRFAQSRTSEHGADKVLHPVEEALPVEGFA